MIQQLLVRLAYVGSIGLDSRPYWNVDCWFALRSYGVAKKLFFGLTCSGWKQEENESSSGKSRTWNRRRKEAGIMSIP